MTASKSSKLNLPFSLFIVAGKGKRFRSKVFKKHIRNYIRKIKISGFIGVLHSSQQFRKLVGRSIFPRYFLEQSLLSCRDSRYRFTGQDRDFGRT